MRRPLRSPFRRMFAAPPEPRPWWRVIVWWEVRRIPYNLIVGCVAIASLLLFCLFITLSQEFQEEDAFEPIALLIALLIAPLLINIAYTAGWILELFLRAIRKGLGSFLGPGLLATGLIFSLLVVLTPATLSFLVWLGKLLAGKLR